VSAETAPRRRYLGHWVFIPPTLAAMVVVPLLLARLEWQPFSIPSASMKPTLEIGDCAFARHFHFIEPRSGDVVVFETHDTHFVKRIVGMPGDRLRLAAGAIYINGIPL
jgi:signal peptidase I